MSLRPPRCTPCSWQRTQSGHQLPLCPRLAEVWNHRQELLSPLPPGYGRIPSVHFHFGLSQSWTRPGWMPGHFPGLMPPPGRFPGLSLPSDRFPDLMPSDHFPGLSRPPGRYLAVPGFPESPWKVSHLHSPVTEPWWAILFPMPPQSHNQAGPQRTSPFRKDSLYRPCRQTPSGRPLCFLPVPRMQSRFPSGAFSDSC